MVSFGITSFFTVAAASLVSSVDIASQSNVGRSLISKARLLNNDKNDYNFAATWVAKYSIKFQGCHTIKQWNYNADDENDVMIINKSLVRFRLCPSDSCSANKGGGCSSGYGDYIIGLNDFMSSYWEVYRQDMEYTCGLYMTENCACDDENDGEDNREYCEYDCFNNGGMSQCIDRNPYEAEEGEGQQQDMNLDEYMECRQIRNNNNRRQLNDNNNNNNKYYVGPICGGQGGDVYLGLFTDDACTITPADLGDVDTTYFSLTGYELPYSNTSIVSPTCVSCIERDEHNQEQQQQQDAYGEYYVDVDTVAEGCELLYLEAGKCEVNYPAELVAEPNTNACTYMEGIKIIRKDGTINKSATKPNKVATTFIVLFSMGFAGMAFYVHYLRTRLGAKSDSFL